jgi:hypothetical protein
MRRLIAIAALAVGSCSSPTKPCGPGLCMGCCDELGECLAGTALFECGGGGNKCSACAANQVCSAGACGLFDGGVYDASFPMDPDGNYNLDAGVYDAGRPDAGFDAGFDAGKPDSGVDAGRMDAGFDAGRPDAGSDAGQSDGGDGG